MIRTYTKRPVEAIQWDGSNKVEIQIFLDRYLEERTTKNELIIPTSEGDKVAYEGDYIVKESNGDFYPCKADIFTALYTDSMLMRLIDANEVYKVLDEISKEPAYLHEDEDWLVGIGLAQTALQSAPAITPEFVVSVPMRVEVEPSVHDHYRERFFCPSCNTEIGDKLWDGDHQFGQGTVLSNNEFPDHCPKCGTRLSI